MVSVPRLISLGDFNLPSLVVGLEVAQDFVETMTSIGLHQVIHALTRNSGHIPNLMFLSEQCLADLQLMDLYLHLLSWSDHSLMMMSFSRAVQGGSRFEM